MKKNVLILLTLALVAFFGTAHAVENPTLVQHVDVNQSDFNGITTSLVIRLPNLTLANNCIVASVFYRAGGTGATVKGITDDKGNSYVLSKSVINYTSGQELDVFVAPNITPGARTITVTFTKATQYLAAKVTEFAGVSATSPVDRSNGTTANASTISAGSITPTVAGNLLYQVGFQSSMNPCTVASIYTAGAQPGIAWAFAPGSTQSQDGSYVQYGQYNSTSAINPTLTVNQAANYTNVVLALKKATTGTLPAATGIRVVAVQHVNLEALASPVIQWVTQGNLQIMLSTSTNVISAVTSSNGNVWQSRVIGSDSQDNASAQILDSFNVLPGNQTITIGFTRGDPGHDVMLLDVIGADASPVDLTTHLDNQNQPSGSGSVTTVSIAPSTNNGLVVTVTPVADGTLSTLVDPNQYSLTCEPFPQYQSLSRLDMNNGYGMYYNPDNRQTTFTWNFDGFSAVGYWASAAAAYKASDATQPPSDTTPPVLSGITLSDITQNSAKITWITDEPSSSKVGYGLTGWDHSAENTTMTLSHSLVITGLTANTTYHYGVMSTDASGNTATSGDFTFKTSTQPTDTTPPVISNIRVSSITQNSAKVTWTTDELSNSKVGYGLTGWDRNMQDATMVVSHSLTITGLAADTTYHYGVMSTDASGNTATSSDFTFKTAAPPTDTTPPVISNIRVSRITRSSAVITWTTNETSTTGVDYGTTANYGGTVTGVSGTSHTVTLSGLNRYTRYNYRVRSTDAAGNTATSRNATFTTSFF
jgi:hypothetical protein